jgi:hypothetical protein
VGLLHSAVGQVIASGLFKVARGVWIVQHGALEQRTLSALRVALQQRSLLAVRGVSLRPGAIVSASCGYVSASWGYSRWHRVADNLQHGY